MKTLIILCLVAYTTLNGITQEVVSSGGETQNITGYQISWTIGEAVTETISSGTSILTQGFHQSKLMVTPVDEIQLTGIEVKVFPNPTEDFIIIHLKKPVQNPVYFLYDLTGKVLESRMISSPETKLDIKNYPSGSYLLKLGFDKNRTLKTFRIVKN